MIYQYYVKGMLEAKTPIAIGSGDDTHSDKDVIRDGNNNLFLPGPSLAGVIRQYLNRLLSKDEKQEDELIKLAFGESGKTSHQSLFTFYDAPCQNSPEMTIRDGVAIDYQRKIAEPKRKFNFEVIERGAHFEFRMGLVVYKKELQNLNKIENLLYLILKSLQEEKISVGAKGMRGLGHLYLHELHILKLDFNNREDRKMWLNFSWNSFQSNISLEKLEHTILIPIRNDVEICVDFGVPYSLLIRVANPNTNEEDVTHITSQGQSIIPGTSWTGALRSSIFNIGIDIKKSSQMKDLIDEVFGHVIESKGIEAIKAKASRIALGESLIMDSESFEYTRNKIDRFTGGVVDAALFTEKPSFGGTLKLRLTLKSPQPYEIGVILLGIQDLWYGIQSIGGGSSIGRGILEGLSLKISDPVNGSLECTKNDLSDQMKSDQIKKYMGSLAQFLSKP
jgi:CRISPR/Cas system CSM-associated protein Csm3 (group 7 of RAMP superfamily)